MTAECRLQDGAVLSPRESPNPSRDENPSQDPASVRSADPLEISVNEPPLCTGSGLEAVQPGAVLTRRTANRNRPTAGIITVATQLLDGFPHDMRVRAPQRTAIYR